MFPLVIILKVVQFKAKGYTFSIFFLQKIVSPYFELYTHLLLELIEDEDKTSCSRNMKC